MNIMKAEILVVILELEGRLRWCFNRLFRQGWKPYLLNVELRVGVERKRKH